MLHVLALLQAVIVCRYDRLWHGPSTGGGEETIFQRRAKTIESKLSSAQSAGVLHDSDSASEDEDTSIQTQLLEVETKHTKKRAKQSYQKMKATFDQETMTIPPPEWLDSSDFESLDSDESGEPQRKKKRTSDSPKGSPSSLIAQPRPRARSPKQSATDLLSMFLVQNQQRQQETELRRKEELEEKERIRKEEREDAERRRKEELEEKERIRKREEQVRSNEHKEFLVMMMTMMKGNQQQ